MRGLYAIVDTTTLARRAIEPLPFLEAVLSARPAAVQLRDKIGGARATLDLLRAMQPLCARAGVPLIANDRADLALLARCDGVHLGHDDLPVHFARSLARNLDASAPFVIGASTHNILEIHEAILERPDYMAFGPVYPTISKENPSPVVGLDGLRHHAARIRAGIPGIPVVAIGGITLETAAAVGAIADCVAMIGALVPEASEIADASGLDRGAALLDAVAARARAIHAAVLGRGA